MSTHMALCQKRKTTCEIPGCRDIISISDKEEHNAAKAIEHDISLLSSNQEIICRVYEVCIYNLLKLYNR